MRRMFEGEYSAWGGIGVAEYLSDIQSYEPKYCRLGFKQNKQQMPNIIFLIILLATDEK